MKQKVPAQGKKNNTKAAGSTPAAKKPKKNTAKSGSAQRVHKFQIEDPIRDDKPMSYKELARHVWPYAFLSYGGPMAHIGMFNNKFVKELKWIEEEQYQELMAICQSLPGPTSSQLMIAIGSLMTKNWLGGVMAFSIFAFPAAAFLLWMGLWQQSMLQQDGYQIPELVRVAFQGFQSAAVSIVAQAAWIFSKKYHDKPLHLSIMFCGALIYFLLKKPFFMVLIMVTGALISLFFDASVKTQPPVEAQSDAPVDEEQQQQQEEKLLVVEEKKPERKRTMEWTTPFGNFSIIAFVAIFALLFFLRYTTDVLQFYYMSSFYYIGSLIFGGGHVVVPLMLEEFKSHGLLDENAFWNGFSLASAMPGPLFNFSAYVGALLDGFWGGVLSWIGLFAPAFLVIWGFLPIWDKYRTVPTIQKLLLGMGATSVGFIIVAVFTLQYDAARGDAIASVLCAALSFLLLQRYDVPCPLVVFLGGVFFYLRQFVKF